MQERAGDGLLQVIYRWTRPHNSAPPLIVVMIIMIMIIIIIVIVIIIVMIIIIIIVAARWTGGTAAEVGRNQRDDMQVG